MNLPDAHLAIVEQEKIVDYLLSAAHPDNGGKAAFFLALGFNLEDWQTLAAAFRNMAETGAVTKSMASPHGQKYIWTARWKHPVEERHRSGRYGSSIRGSQRRVW